MQQSHGPFVTAKLLVIIIGIIAVVSCLMLVVQSHACWQLV